MQVLIICPSIWAWWAAVAWYSWQQTEKQVGCLWTCPPSLSSSLKHCFVLTRVSSKNTRFVLTWGMPDQTTGILEQPQILLSLSLQGSIPCSKNAHSLIIHVLPQPASLSSELLLAEADFIKLFKGTLSTQWCSIYIHKINNLFPITSAMSTLNTALKFG